MTPLPRQRRPRAVSFVASLLLFEAVAVVLVGVALTAQELGVVSIGMRAPVWAVGEVIGRLPGIGLATIVVVAGGGLALASIGLLRLREWGWVLAMSLQGVGLADALYETSEGHPPYLLLALGSFVVLVLNQREVRQTVALRHEHA